MNLQEIQEILLSQKGIRSVVHLKRYLKLIGHFQLNKCEKIADHAGVYEIHHILPRKVYPEYAKCDWNLIILPAKAHYLAHYLLFKAWRNKSCAFAFNQMRRISKKNGVVNCRLYAAVRKEIGEFISEMNTGRPVTDELRTRMSDINKGTNVYRNKQSGELRRFAIENTTEDWEPFQTGRVRTDASKNKMSKRMKSRQWQHNPQTNEVRFDHNILEGFIKGVPPEWRGRDFDYLHNSKWVYNTITNEARRINNADPIPENFVEGRKYDNKGFKKINQSGMIKVINLIDKKWELIDQTQFDPTIHMNSGQQLEKTCVYRYQNRIYTKYTDLLECNPEIPDFACRNITLNTKRIPKPHFNMTLERQKFCKLYQGILVTDLELEAIYVTELKYNKDEIYVKSARN